MSDQKHPIILRCPCCGEEFELVFPHKQDLRPIKAITEEDSDE